MSFSKFGRRLGAIIVIAAAIGLGGQHWTATVADAAIQPSSLHADPTTYTVKPGDTLSGIAAQFGVKESAIQEANGLQNPDSIRFGQVLTIPGATPPPPPQPAEVKYTVKAGDTVSTIAESFGVQISAIQAANGLESVDMVRIGMVLTIPGATQPVPTVAPPPAPTQTPVPAPTPTPETKYTVKAGDTLYGIATNFGVKPSAIQDANGLQDGNSIRAGQVLTIPGAKPAQPSPSPQPSATPAATPSPSATPAPSPTAGSPTATAVAQAAATPSGDPRYFAQTGFRIDNDRFWEYFQRRGAVGTFGYPISKEFTLLGFRVQFFQRLVMQLGADGNVATMNLLDEGVMPFTRINFSTYPGPDKGMAEAAPKPGADGWFDRLLAFVKERSPNQWNDLGVNFHKAFNETVKYEDAYPDKKQDPGIMPAINLELWGVPISPPAFDPNNKNFVYLRFQRGIMHYDKASGATQGLLLGDYLKSIITGVNLPEDLAEQAKGSRFYMQYAPGSAGSLARPNELPGTDMSGAFTRDGVIVIDPGHGGTQVGAAHIFSDGKVVTEKDLNLKVALKMADLLRRAGRQVQLTRTTDTQVNNPPRDLTGDGRMTLDDDLQARVDIANKAGASVFVSVHFNGSGNTAMNGAEMYYNAKRPFSDKNRQLAQRLLDGLLTTTKASGYSLANRGVKNDELSVGLGNSLYLLGPTDQGKPRATTMVGALTEGAFLTNDQDAMLVRQEKFVDAIAQGYVQGILSYLQNSGR